MESEREKDREAERREGRRKYKRLKKGNVWNRKKIKKKDKICPGFIQQNISITIGSLHR